LSVGFTTAAALVHELMEARDEKKETPPSLPEITGCLSVTDH
jgi:predicted outer membrane lipoprotein